MFERNRPPKTKDVQAVNPYYLQYDGSKGYAQVVGRIEKKFVAIMVTCSDGSKVNRVMKVSERKFFFDFGGTCTQFDIIATGFILNS